MQLRQYIMLAVFAAFWILPIRLGQRQLLTTAFFVWLIGGAMLLWLGASRLIDPATHLPHNTIFYLGLALALVVGFGKGKFVLAKTSERNIERIEATSEPQLLRHIYSLRSWIMIGLMMLISVSLTWFGVDPFWRGCVNIAIGLALIMSSLNYSYHLNKTPINGAAA